jgi:hypothetical protein
MSSGRLLDRTARRPAHDARAVSASARRFASLLVAALILAIPAVPAASAGPVGDAVPAAKQKPKKCKKSQVRVRIGKRVSCRPAKKVLPKPKAGDERLLLARSAYGSDWSRLRGRRGKRVPSLPKLIRKLGPRAPALLAKATARGIARVDALAAGASSAARVQAQAAAAGCQDIPKGAKKEDSFTSKGGDGTTAKVTATIGAEGAGMVMELSGHGFTVKVDLDFGACEPNEVEAPSCPTAAGRLDGKIRYKLRVGIEVTKDGDDVWSQFVDIARSTRLEGWTDDDAKLDRLDVEDVETSNFRLGGSIRAYPPISIRTRIVRKTRVAMRSGAYEPDRSDINVTVGVEGLGGPDRADVEDDIAEQSRAEADRQFRAIVDKAIKGYRDREDAWQEANKCATLEFSPAPNTRRLQPGQSGSFNATAIAKERGGPSELDARLSNPVNAIFSPTRAGGQRAHFGYTVASAPASDKVRSTIRATSKAGVAQGDWEQDVDRPNPPPPAYVGPVSGTAVYDQNELGAGNSLEASWSGSLVLRQVPTGYPPGTPGAPSARYALTAGSIQYGFNGRVGGCNVVGSAPIDLAAQQDVAGSAFLHVYDGAPRRYQLQIPLPLLVTVHGQKSVCDDPNDNGTDFPWVPGTGIPYLVNAPLPGGPVGDNWSLLGAGAGNNGAGTPDQTWQWSLGPSS